MHQLIVECSEPGLVVALTEQFEYVLRHVDFQRAIRFRDQLSALAQELGSDVERIWRGFRLETPNEVGCRPLAFSSRETLDRQPMERLTSAASQRDIGSFEVGGSLLLNQSGPPPETREQYVRDLASGIRGSDMALGVFSRPVPLPQRMADHREHLVEAYVLPRLQARARRPALGRKWIRDTDERLKSALEEVNTRAEAVMAYELGRLDPKDQKPGERVRWTALAVRLGSDAERWYAATADALPHLYQRAALAWLLWSDARGPTPARSFLEERLASYVEQAESVYTVDGVEALSLLYQETQKPPWSGLGDLFAPVDEASSPAAEKGEHEEPGADEAPGDGNQSAP